MTRGTDPEWAAIEAAGGNPRVPRCALCRAVTARIHGLRRAENVRAAWIELVRELWVVVAELRERAVVSLGSMGVLERVLWAEAPVEAHGKSLERLWLEVVREVEERARWRRVRLDDIFPPGGRPDMQVRPRVALPLAPVRREERIVLGELPVGPGGLPALRPSRVVTFRVGGGAGAGAGVLRAFAEPAQAVQVGTVPSGFVAKVNAPNGGQWAASRSLPWRGGSDEE